MKRLLNRNEEETNSVLRPLTEEWGAHTFPKVRLADILPIESSGIDDQSFRFALQSHFDFVVTDADLLPLFAIEFDDPTHVGDEQMRRDRLKSAFRTIRVSVAPHQFAIHWREVSAKGSADLVHQLLVCSAPDQRSV